jgi:hypothetical protein
MEARDGARGPQFGEIQTQDPCRRLKPPMAHRDSVARRRTFTKMFIGDDGEVVHYHDTSIGSLKRKEELEKVHQERVARISATKAAAEAERAARRELERERLIRRHEKLQKRAATKIQAVWRGGAARRRVVVLQAMRALRRRDEMVTRLQSRSCAGNCYVCTRHGCMCRSLRLAPAVI